MNILRTDELNRFREYDLDIVFVLKVFEEIERVYRDALEAMGIGSERTFEVSNSADVIISFNSALSLSTDLNMTAN